MKDAIQLRLELEYEKLSTKVTYCENKNETPSNEIVSQLNNVKRKLIKKRKNR